MFTKGLEFFTEFMCQLHNLPYRMGPNSPLALGSLEDDNRGKSNNRHRRIGDPNMGRAQGSPWRGVQNWPSPVAKGFIPFQHGPPPVDFHPVMQQFPPPPMFSIRPSMELNQSGVPYHVPDGDRFSSHGRSLGWRNLVDESCPPIHGWDANNTVFGDESHIYGRLDWDHHRRLTDGYSAHGPADDVWAEQTSLEAQNDKKQPSVQVESVDIDQSSDALERNTLKAAPKTIPGEIPNLSRKDAACLSHNLNTEEADSKLLLVEEAIDATVKISNKTSSGLLFPTIKDSVLQNAMSLYKKLKEEARTINGDKLPFSNVENLEAAPALDLEVAGSNEDKLGELVPACGQQEAEVAASALTKVKMEVFSAITNEKINEPDLADALEKPEGSIAALNKVKMELNLVPKQETLDYIVEVKSSSPQNVETSDTHSPGKVDEVNGASDSKGNCFATIKEGQKFHDANKCASLPFSGVSPEACTLIDGEPIIRLPPKTIHLTKVDFSPEERAFYAKLEADSRSQFKAYAAAGTVNQNYANILLMLLRLRQACDHPLLVKGFSSEPVRSDSLDLAKRIPREKLINLLNLLETSLAICRYCSDPPEDAVVTMCGHVFCYQCVSEYMTGDDNMCPAPDCKKQVGVDVVFSKATLRRCISEDPDNNLSSSSEFPGKSIILKNEYSSSKIRATLEILQKHCKSKSPTSESHNLVRCNGDSSYAGKAFSDSSHSGVGAATVVDLDTEPEGPIKAIVFSQWTSMLDLVQIALNQSCLRYRRLDGTMTLGARDRAVKEFNTDPEVTVMLMSLKAGNLGLNMVAACHVILLDLWWNPATEDQAIDRAHRIGQTRPVTVSRITIKDTVEDRILALQEEKRKMVASAFGEDQSGGSGTRLTVEDLKYLFMV
ncbi:Helicase-like transcription factor CHR28 [Camellia lanceoleosa]|uniref:Helicase-like transcription factor CHR28 n=1 Tax=Camellia lanceoleosa TaxID=1840588 RepID=A0ACC0G3I0_9ERIC|nr:Helicase-like transcription factor CHR28 [Camellia lanceoleosa]